MRLKAGALKIMKKYQSVECIVMMLVESFNRASWKEMEQDVQAGDTIIFKDICRFTRNGIMDTRSIWNY